jgi:hypothetical protein
MTTTKADAVYVVVERGKRAGPAVGSTFDPAYTSQIGHLSNGNLTFDGRFPPYAIMRFAVDADAGLVWMWSPWEGQWNTQSLDTSDPGAHLGGFTFTAAFPLSAGTLLKFHDVNAQVTYNFGGSPFAYPVPSGFTAYGASVTLDPSSISPPGGIILSNGNLTASANGSTSGTVVNATRSISSGKWYWEMAVNAISKDGIVAGMLSSLSNGFGYNSWGTPPGNWNLSGSTQEYDFVFNSTHPFYDYRTAMSIIGHSTGKWYFEGTVNVANIFGGPFDAFVIGLCNHFQATSADTFGFGSTVGDLTGNGIAAQDNGNIYFQNVNVGTMDAWGSGVVGQTIGCAVDLDAHLVWFWNSSTGQWNAHPSYSPATGVGGVSFAGLIGPIYTCVQVTHWGLNEQMTMNWGPSGFVNAVPAGFMAWGGIPSGPKPSYTIERFDNRVWPTVENCWCVDCGFTLEQPTPAADLTVTSM